jgi:hypothetical protein
MSQQTINIGSAANDGTGDPIRTAMGKINDNFTEIYDDYQTQSGLSSNVATLTSNNTSYVGAVTAANVVSNAQLVANLTNYAQLSSGLFTGAVNATSHTVGTSFTANSTVVNAVAINVVNQTNTSTLYVTTSANVGTYFTVNSSSASKTVNSSFSGANLYVNTTNTTFVSNTTFSSAVSIASNTVTLGTSTNAANGYTYLPNGFKLNWGWVSANSSSGNAIFTSAYTTNAYAVTATSNSTVATYQAAVIGTNTTVVQIRTANVASTNVFWQAIGY